MKPGSSSLNPYAASYVPLFKRGPADTNKENSPQGFNTGNEFVQYGHQPFNAFQQGQHRNVSQSYAHSAGPIQSPEYHQWKDHRGGEFVASTSQYHNQIPEKSHYDEDFDMDLAFLQMTFPGISEDSLSDVYLANSCDVDAAVEMLNQLEVHHDDSSHKLPDTLDIGDVPESEELKKTKAERGASTSGSYSMHPKS
ncbi:hypothetical protein ACS0TY_022761 [Phlomoides rotata]